MINCGIFETACLDALPEPLGVDRSAFDCSSSLRLAKPTVHHIVRIALVHLALVLEIYQVKASSTGPAGSGGILVS